MQRLSHFLLIYSLIGGCAPPCPPPVTELPLELPQTVAKSIRIEEMTGVSLGPAYPYFVQCPPFVYQGGPGMRVSICVDVTVTVVPLLANETGTAVAWLQCPNRDGTVEDCLARFSTLPIQGSVNGYRYGEPTESFWPRAIALHSGISADRAPIIQVDQ